MTIIYTYSRKSSRIWIERPTTIPSRTRAGAAKRNRERKTTIHDHRKRIPTPEIEELRWSKAMELAKVARSEGKHFDSSNWLHKAKESTKQELKEQVHKYLTGEDYEPYEMVYFKLCESQLPVLERAL